MLVEVDTAARRGIGQEEWLHLRDNLIFYCSFHSGESSEKRLIFLEPFSYERLLLGGPHNWRIIAGVVKWHKHGDRLCHVILHIHC